MKIKVVVAAEGCNGPDLFFCKVELTEEQYEAGRHYEIAKGVAVDYGYDSPMVAFDEKDPPKPMFDLFSWDQATVYNCP